MTKAKRNDTAETEVAELREAVQAQNDEIKKIQKFINDRDINLYLQFYTAAIQANAPAHERDIIARKGVEDFYNAFGGPMVEKADESPVALDA